MQMGKASVLSGKHFQFWEMLNLSNANGKALALSGKHFQFWEMLDEF